MGKKQALTLSSVLESFENSLNKQAEEEIPAEPVEPEEVVETGEVQPDTAEAAEVAAEAQEAAEKEVNEAIEEKAEEVAEAEAVKDNAVEGLKAIAKTASENSEIAMHKEAEEFGRIFAHSFMEEMEKKAQDQEEYSNILKQAYEVMDGELMTEKLASVFNEAYELGSFRLMSEQSYEKTAEVLNSLEKNAEAVETAVENDTVEQAKDMVKQAYQITQEFIDKD